MRNTGGMKLIGKLTQTTLRQSIPHEFDFKFENPEKEIRGGVCYVTVYIGKCSNKTANHRLLSTFDGSLSHDWVLSNQIVAMARFCSFEYGIHLISLGVG